MTNNPATRRAFSAGQFELRIDDVATPAYLKSVEGGFAKMNHVDVQIGSDPLRVKHVTSREVDPITAEIGMAHAFPVLGWIQQSWAKKWSRHNGAITHCNFNYEAQLIQEFYDALIEEASFGPFDAGSKDALMLKVKLRPERVEIKKGDNHKVQGNAAARQKVWMCSAFRLKINGVDTTHVQKIDAFTVKQGIKPLAPGKDRWPQLEPTSVTFPDLKVTMSAPYQTSKGDGMSMLEWYEQVVIKGARDTNVEKEGFLEILSPDRKKVLATINLLNVGIKGMNVAKSDAHGDAIKRCTFDLYVGSMDLGGDINPSTVEAGY